MTNNIEMKIVVPVYNAQDWIYRCLLSIKNQEFTNWKCIVINDASTDNTKSVIEDIDFLKNDERFIVQHNDTNVKALQNIVDGFNILGCKNNPESILMAIDGDDFLFSEWSLGIISQAYTQLPQLLLSYGNWVGYPDGTTSNCRRYNNETIRDSDYRIVPFTASHLRTFKSRLWYAIDDKDLRDDTGEYFSAGWDVAFMVPMLEMAQERHVFIDHVLYCYNRINPISDFRVHAEPQLNAVDVIKGRKKYERH